jgi:hypothetical protein
VSEWRLRGGWRVSLEGQVCNFISLEMRDSEQASIVD